MRNPETFEMLAAQSDPEACQTCGAPFAAPECVVCFDARWTRDDDDQPLALLGSLDTHGAIASDERR